MEFTGTLKDISLDWNTKQYQITFTVNEETALEQADTLKDCKLSIKAEKHREKRSLNANSYFHVLVGKLADSMRISKPRCKNTMLYRYGQPYLLDDGKEAVIKSNVPATQMLEQEHIHCFPCGWETQKGAELTYYRVYRGSHTYDTREMSVLIDGIVEECKEQNIETLTPNELAKLKALWGAK